MFLIYFLSRRHRQPRPFRNPLQQPRLLALSLLSKPTFPFSPVLSFLSLSLSSSFLSLPAFSSHRALAPLFIPCSFLFLISHHFVATHPRLRYLLISPRQVSPAHTLACTHVVSSLRLFIPLPLFFLRTCTLVRIIVWTLQTTRPRIYVWPRTFRVVYTPGLVPLSLCVLRLGFITIPLVPFAGPTFISLKSPGISEIALSYGNITRLRAGVVCSDNIFPGRFFSPTPRCFFHPFFSPHKPACSLARSCSLLFPPS